MTVEVAASAGEDFGALLRRLRAEANLSQEELAERAGLSAKAISALERGERRRPHPNTVRSLAAALGTDEATRAALSAAVPSRQPAEVPTAQRTAPSPSWLTAPATRLLGRSADTEALVELLEDSAVRLVTVTGPGGVGKTRVALRVAELLHFRSPGGVVLVPLAAVQGEDHVWPSVAAALNLPAARGAPTLQALAGSLADRPFTLVLDNLEHLLGIASDLAWLLTACPELKVLCTSRAPLRVRGERNYALPPLSIPQADGSDVTASEAVALFVDRVRDVQPDFALTAASTPAAVALCRRLDGLPLAIEIAAAQLRHVDLDVLVTRLDGVLGAPGQSDLPERQRTLRETLRWSHERLDASAQAVYRRLSVFLDGCTLDAAEAVVSGAGVPREAVLPALGRLVENSLLATDRTGPLRYRMLEPVRQHGLELLDEAGEGDQFRGAHARWFAALAYRPGPTPVDQRGLARYARLAPEHRNLVAAVEWFLSEEPATAAQLTWDLWGVWLARGHRVEGLALAERALACAEGAAARCRAAVAAGTLAYLEADLPRSEALLTQGLRNADAAGDVWLRAHALGSLGAVASLQGRHDEAERWLAEASASAEEAGDFGEVALAELARGTAALRRGDVDAARTRFQCGADAASTSGHQPGIGMAGLLLGELASSDGDQATAEAHLLRAVDAVIAVGERLQIGACAEGLAVVAVRSGQPARAARLFGVADRLFTQAQGQRYAHLVTDEAALQGARDTARQDLGDEAFRVAVAAGAAMSEAEAWALLRAPLAAP